MGEKGNREYKSSVFAMLLREKENALEVYNAVNGTSYESTDDLKIQMLESAVYLSFRNDASFIIASTLNLYEHQSTYNPNMPLRDLIYVANILADLVKNENLFGTALVKIPLPKFVTFYNGVDERPEMEVLKLSDAFEVQVENPELELKCTVVNINAGQNTEFMKNCRILSEYTVFVDKVRLYRETIGLEEAIEKAIDECIREHVLEEFLKSQRAEVISMSVLEFDLEKQLGFARAEGREEGERHGRMQGSDLKLISQICRKLGKGKTAAAIADELDEDLDVVEQICEIAAGFAPEYNTEKIYEALQERVAS